MDLIQSALAPLDAINEVISAPLQAVSEATGFITIDKAKYIFCALLCYPFAVLFRLLPNNPTLKHLYGTLIGLWFGYFVFGTQIYHAILTSTIVLLIVKLFPPSIARYVVFAFSLGYLCVSHLYRMWLDYLGWTLDYTGPQMLLTIKFTLFAFDVKDMELSKDKIEKLAPPLRDHLLRNQLKRFPSILEYYSYIFFFTGFLSGPVPFVAEHLSFVDGTMFSEFGGRVPPGSVFAAFKIFIYALIAAGGVVLQGYFPLSYLATAEFGQQGMLYKLVFGYVAAALIRHTYYFAWLMAESACILIGFGYNGKNKDGSIRWDRASSVRPLGVELAQSFKEVTENWNLSADKWLRYYIYFRLPRHLEPYGVYITFFTSAFWHGFYPGYYISFLSAAIGTVFFRAMFRRIRPRMLNADGKPNIVYKIGATVITGFLLNYFFVPFVLLSLEGSIAYYVNMRFIGHIIFVILFAVALSVPQPKVNKTA